LLGSISSAFPVSGSFSRSALNFTVGAKTPLSKAICLFIILLVLSVLTPYFYFIPNAALSGIIWVAINSLVDFSDLWEVCKPCTRLTPLCSSLTPT
jgi:SulP family sulfate permease